MKKIVILISIFTAQHVCAQSIYFNNRYDFFYENKDLGNSIALSDSGYLVACSVGNSAINYLKLGLLSLDKNGNILWTKLYGQSGYYYYPGYNSLFKLIDGNYIIGGQIVDSTDHGNSFLTKFAPNGDTIWFKQYQDSIYNNAVYQIKPAIDGGFLLIGTTNSYENNYNVLLQKTDSFGNLEWQKTYGVPVLTDEGWSIDICANGDYIIGGYRENSSNIFENYILRIDSLGVLKWDTLFGAYSISIVTTTSDNGFVVATDFLDSIYDAYSYSTLNIIKFDSIGHILWNKKYGGARFIFEAYTIIEIKDSGFVITGNTANIADTINNMHVMGFIARINSQGDSLWYRNYDIAQYVESQNYLTDIKQTTDGGFVACGYARPNLPDTGNQDIWVLKVDSNGCEVPWCMGTGINEPILEKGAIKVYPNPNNGNFNIDYHLTELGIRNYELRIYDVLGKRVYSTDLLGIDGTQNIDVSTLSNGVYFYQVTNNKETLRGKFIIEK